MWRKYSCFVSLVDQVIGMARVMEDYASQEPGEISLPRGGIINVYEVIDDEWSRGELNGKVGRYPSKVIANYWDFVISAYKAKYFEL